MVYDPAPVKSSAVSLPLTARFKSAADDTATTWPRLGMLSVMALVAAVGSCSPSVRLLTATAASVVAVTAAGLSVVVVEAAEEAAVS